MWRRIVWIPIILLVGWFLVEQLPLWFAPQPPWTRYPDLVALPGGCEAANALRLYGAARGADETTALTADDAQTTTVALIEQQYPDERFTFALPPELVRGSFGDTALAWFGIAMFARDDTTAPAGAIVFLDAQSGAPLSVITVLGAGIEGADGVCGAFAPRPQGLRAALRPYLPLLALAGYVGIVGMAAGIVWWRNKKAYSRG
ncbi:MAG: hypothetical protein SF123_06460 [Chloroflexota bacterium]|nr:hypothetical protein [Chloroflexota bacterium]